MKNSLFWINENVGKQSQNKLFNENEDKKSQNTQLFGKQHILIEVKGLK